MKSKKSFFLGIGTGIIITTFIFFVAYSFQVKEQSLLKNTQISNEEIISRAKKLGMSKLKEVLSTEIEDTKENNISELDSKPSFLVDEKVPLAKKEIDDSESIDDDLETVIEVSKSADEDLKVVAENSRKIEVVIPEGSTSIDIAELLREKKVINDALKFTMFLKEKDATKKLRFGEFIFTENMDYQNILDIISK